MTSIAELALNGDPNRVLGAPAVPPRDWFFEIPDGWDPVNDLDAPLIYVDTDGRFAALMAPFDECILDAGRRRGECWMAPESQTNYEYAYNGKRWPTVAANGEIEYVRIGNVCADIPHATGRETPEARRAAFDDTSKIRSRVRYHDRRDLGAIYALGAMNATATVWDALCLQAVGLSGEWWPVKGLPREELVGPIVVAEQGLRGTLRRRQVTRRAAVFASASIGDDGPIVAGWQTAAVVDECATCGSTHIETLGEAREGGGYRRRCDHGHEWDDVHFSYGERGGALSDSPTSGAPAIESWIVAMIHESVAGGEPCWSSGCDTTPTMLIISDGEPFACCPDHRDEFMVGEADDTQVVDFGQAVTSAGLFDESKVSRGDGGQFAKKGEGTTGRKPTVVTVTGKPKGKAGGKGKKKKAGGGGKPKPTEEQKVAEAKAKTDAANAKRLGDLAGKTNGMSDGATGDVAKEQEKAISDAIVKAAELHATDPDGAVKALTDAFDAADRMADAQDASPEVGPQMVAARAAKLRTELSTTIKALGGDAPISKVSAEKKARTIQGQNAREVDMERKAGERSKATKARTEAKATRDTARTEAKTARDAKAAESKAARETAKATRDTARAEAKAAREKKAAETKAARDAKAAETAAKKGASVTTEIQTAAADSAVPPETPSGAVLVALPAPGQWTDQIEDAHCTIAYVPGDLAADGIDTLIAYAEQEAASRAPFVVTTAGTGRIGGEGAAAVFINSADLVELHNESTDDLEERDGIEQSYPSFLPHLTTGYDAEPITHDSERTIIFDRLAVWNGEDRTEYPFTGDEAFAPAEPDQTTDMEEPAMATAGPITIPVVLSVTTVGMPDVVTTAGTFTHNVTHNAAAPCSCQTHSAHAGSEGKEAVMADETPEVAVAAADVPEVDADQLDATPEAAAPTPDVAAMEQRIGDLEDAVRELLAAEAARQAKEVPDMMSQDVAS